MRGIVAVLAQQRHRDSVRHPSSPHSAATAAGNVASAARRAVIIRGNRLLSASARRSITCQDIAAKAVVQAAASANTRMP